MMTDHFPPTKMSYTKATKSVFSGLLLALLCALLSVSFFVYLRLPAFLHPLLFFPLLSPPSFFSIAALPPGRLDTGMWDPTNVDWGDVPVSPLPPVTNGPPEDVGTYPKCTVLYNYTVSVCICVCVYVHLVVM